MIAADRPDVQDNFAEKPDSAGQLAAGIAQQLNTPIQFVGDTTQFLDSAFGDLMQLVEVYSELHVAARSGPVPPELLQRVAEAEERADLDDLRERVPAAFQRSSDGLERVSAVVDAIRQFCLVGSWRIRS
ncbi:MAG: diguanylate cyclase [Thermoleophilaceae bacterium]|jgi:hypothetical protein|nr:diguanylate cyclase [Thermoleophilaceae bacterium]